jgi:hypothetical protein
MNYLQLVNDFMIETDMDDQIVTVTGQIDDGLKATIWIRDAWTQIQRNEKWDFMFREGFLPTIIGQDSYDISTIQYNNYPNDTIGSVDINSFRNEATKTRMSQAYAESLRWQTGTGSPTRVALSRDATYVIVAPVPVVVEALTMDTWSSPIVLTLDTDTPTLAPEFHKAIVWVAISNYAREQGAEWNGLYLAANREFNQIYSTMTNRYMPRMFPKVGLTN